MSGFRFLLALLATLALAPLGPSAVAKDTLVIGVNQFPGTLHPYFEQAFVGAFMRGFATRWVTAFDPDWKSICLMCTGVPSIENGLLKTETEPDGKPGLATTITLRPDLYWGDGECVTSKDIEFTWRAAHDPASGFQTNDTWRQISRVDVVDDRTAILHFSPPSYLFNRIRTLLPAHIEGPILAKVAAPADYKNQTQYSRAPTTPGLWNGPWLVTDYQSGSQIVLEPNPYWHGTKPGFRRIVVKAITDTAALKANLLAGDIDTVAGDNGVGLTVDQVIAMRKDYPDRFDYLINPSPNFVRVDFMLDNPIFADIRVRRALLMAVDRKTLVDTVYDGKATVADTWTSPLDPSFTPDVTTYPYDPAAAKSLLEDAGWTPGADGVRRNASGDRLSFELLSISGNRLYELQQVVLQNAWQVIGVETTLKAQPIRTVNEVLLMALPGWRCSRGPAAVPAGCRNMSTQAHTSRRWPTISPAAIWRSGAIRQWTPPLTMQRPSSTWRRRSRSSSRRRRSMPTSCHNCRCCFAPRGTLSRNG